MAHDAEREAGQGRGSYAVRGGLPGHARDAVSAQHERFGGLSWASAFFGWLSANGLAVLLLALLSAGGVALGVTQGATAGEAQAGAEEQAATVGIAGGIAVLVLLAIAYFAGGYVAGRMARFDGARQGVGVWLIGLIVVVLLAAAGAVFGAEYNVLAQLDLPRIPVDEGAATTGGLVFLAAAVVVTLLAALLGGRTGVKYHRKIDRAGFGAD